jgi:hypothetical protein
MTTIAISADQAWRDFINRLEESNPEVYQNLWMKTTGDEDWQKWRWLVQGAFIEGYFRGKEKMITGE